MFTAAFALLACGDDAAPVDGGARVDGSAADADAPVGDGATDATTPDGGDGTIDADADGVPAALDCDDSDPDIGATASRACTSACASGIESCTDGTWGACSAPTDCACETPGMMRTVDCGRCGTASQRCGDDLVWELPSECFGERECFAADIERDTAMCGMRARLCDSECMWLPWETSVEPGECEAGVSERTTAGCDVGEYRDRSCSASCAWEPGACIAGCARPAAGSRTGADPICIPAGPFNFGRLVLPVRPRRTFILSEFHMDRNPVTKARYEHCVTAGGCTPSADAWYVGAPMDHWAAVSQLQAVAFCTWDGGFLPDEFQWEKAARGAAPSQNLHAWGDFQGGCEHHPWMGCELLDSFPITSYPMSVSDYGVHLMGVLMEATSGRYGDASTWSALPETDPVVTTGPCCTGRGMPLWTTPSAGGGWNYQSDNIYSAITRWSGSGANAGFRCAY